MFILLDKVLLSVFHSFSSILRFAYMELYSNLNNEENEKLLSSLLIYLRSFNKKNLLLFLFFIIFLHSIEMEKLHYCFPRTFFVRLAIQVIHLDLVDTNFRKLSNFSLFMTWIISSFISFTALLKFFFGRTCIQFGNMSQLYLVIVDLGLMSI